MQAARILRWAILVLAIPVVVGTSLLRAQEAPGDGEKWLANDSEIVVSVNVKQMLNSAAVKKEGLEPLKGLIAGNEHLKAVLDAIGLDPLKDLHSITLSGSATSAKDVKALVVVRGKFDLEKVQTAAEKFAKKSPDDLKVLKDDKGTLYEVKANDMALVAGFVDSTALVLTPSKEMTLEAIKNGGKKEAKVNKDLKSAMAKFDGKESIAIAMVVNDELKKALGKLPQAAEIAPKLQTVTGAITLTDSASTILTINTDDAKTAGKTIMLVKQLKALGELMVLNNEEVGPIAQEMLNALKIEQAGSSVTATLKVTKEMVEKAGKKDK